MAIGVGMQMEPHQAQLEEMVKKIKELEAANADQAATIHRLNEEVCKALNAMFYKVPKVLPEGDTNENARWWVSEMMDKDIYIVWNEITGEFEPKPL